MSARSRPAATGGPARTNDTTTATLAASRQDGKKFGLHVRGDVVRWTVREGQALRVPPAFAKSEALLREAQTRGAVRAEVEDLRDPERPLLWTCKVADFFGPHSGAIARAGFERQRFLPLRAPCWAVEGDAEAVMSVLAERRADEGDEPAQLTLADMLGQPDPDPADWRRDWRRRPA
jgi:hypothetical protein